MKEMISGVTAIPQSSFKRLVEQKAAQDLQTTRLASETVALIGTADPDQQGFLTKVLRGFRMAQTAETGALAFLPDDNPSYATPYYKAGTPVVLDRAGTGAYGLNIVKSGLSPDGYYNGGDKLMVQSRYKQYYRGSETDTSNTNWNYGLRVRAMIVDERLDGDFFPGSIHLGVGKPYGVMFAKDGSGQRLYSGDPFTPEGWNGVANPVVTNIPTAPVIDAIDPNTFQLPGTPIEITITGSHLTGCGFVFIGPFLPAQISISVPSENSYILPDPLGAFYYRRILDDNNLVIASPPNMVAGVYDVIVIGVDGQVAVKEQFFTVLAEVA
jgi:hypothetical protein